MLFQIILMATALLPLCWSYCTLFSNLISKPRQHGNSASLFASYHKFLWEVSWELFSGKVLLVETWLKVSLRWNLSIPAHSIQEKVSINNLIQIYYLILEISFGVSRTTNQIKSIYLRKGNQVLSSKGWVSMV